MDETGLFYKFLTRKIYIYAFEERKTARFTKAMKAKNRFKAYGWANADGSHEKPLAVIGKSSQPRFFRLGFVPFLYFSRKVLVLIR